MHFLYAGKKHIKSRQGNDAKNLQRKQKQSGMVQKKVKMEGKIEQKLYVLFICREMWNPNKDAKNFHRRKQ